MKTYLKSQCLWKVVETNESPPALGENQTVAQLRNYETESLKKDKALTCLHSGIADQIFTSIMDLETPKVVWDKLQETFEARMMDIVNQMRLQEVVKDQKVVEKIMISVPLKFEAAQNLKQTLLEEKVLAKGITKFGHLEKNYRAKKAHSNTQRIQQENVFEEDHVDDENLFMASHLDKHPNSLTWLMDSRCISHMTLERSFFISLDTADNPRVKLEDGRYAQAKRRGTIAINTNKGTKYISRVLYMPELDRSMLSVPQMIKNGYGVNFKNDSRCVITDSRDSKIVILDIVNDSYYLKLDVANASAFSVTEDDNMPPISEVDIPEFDIKYTNDTDVLRTRTLVDVYESYSSVTRILSKKTVQHGRSKHINVKYQFVREAEKNSEVKLKYCTSETQLANMLTKSITGKKLNYFKAHLMKSNNNLKEESKPLVGATKKRGTAARATSQKESRWWEIDDYESLEASDTSSITRKKVMSTMSSPTRKVRLL
ncbi:retrovirus-related pol polyprotein from transposon TNT 1-94, partial [Tanacetum coccineum]